jgi:plasmid stabilization system protein ParE
MKRCKIRVIDAAHTDMREARAWYRAKNPQLPRRFTQQVKIVMERIRNRPGVHAVRYQDVRIANLAIFPYAVHYLVEGDTVIVLAVHHTAIDPAKWAERR